MHRVLYKSNIIEIEKTVDESEKEFHIRKWFILKNLPNDFINTSSSSVISKKNDKLLKNLNAMSKIHIKNMCNNCVYDENVMKKLKDCENNLYMY